ncbi:MULTISPECIES: hypothetical protein [unclassified Paenibacillus]|uniref:hypothetical protein n=1 Tax=unclassified Paenibacillus TaxID=185978 RepID=UPI0030F9D522
MTNSSRPKYPRVKIRWIPGGENHGMEPETFRGILLPGGALYRVQDGNAALGIVEPTDEPGVYRLVGADITLLNKGSLSKLAQRLTDMTALQLLLSIVPHVNCPEELPI